MICFEEFQRKDVRSAACKHGFCLECWCGYIGTAVGSGPAVLDLRCPLPACKAEVRRSRGCGGALAVGFGGRVYGHVMCLLALRSQQWGHGRTAAHTCCVVLCFTLLCRAVPCCVVLSLCRCLLRWSRRCCVARRALMCCWRAMRPLLCAALWRTTGRSCGAQVGRVEAMGVLKQWHVLGTTRCW
jgi:hypothetical protein